MPSRKKRIKRTKLRIPNLFFLTVSLIFFVILFLLGKLLTGQSIWPPESKLVLVQPESLQGDVNIIILDGFYSEKLNIKIPENSEVEVSGNLGKRRIGNLWKLGIDEKKEGILLQRTIETNYKFPVDGWVGLGSDLTKTNLYSLAMFVAGKGSSSLGLKDRLKVALFCIKTTFTTQINLSETSFLSRGNLSDGREGYLLGEDSDKVLSFFADKNISDSTYKVMIKRKFGSLSSSEKIGSIIESMGIKPAYSLSAETGNSGCVVYTNNKYLLTKLKNVLPCKVVKEKNEIFDAVIAVDESLEKEF